VEARVSADETSAKIVSAHTGNERRGCRPTFYQDQNWDWSDRNREQELHDYYRAPYYWG
jgi:hypothetical protein